MMDVRTKLTLKVWNNNPAYFFEEIFNHPAYPYQAKVLQDLKDMDKHRVLVLSAGGTGKTKLLAGLALYFAVPKSYALNRPIDIIIISGSQSQSRFLYDYCRQAIMSNDILNRLVDGEPLVSMTRFKNKSTIYALPNSLTAIQGKHSDIVIVDEASLAGDFIVRDTLRITSTSDIDIIILSGTPLQYDCLFVDMWENPKEYPEWKHRYHWSARECPNISIDRLEEAKRLPPDMYAIFWEGKPYALTNTLIPIEDLKRASRNVHVEYDKNIPCVAGIDWGWRSETVLVIRQTRDGIHYIVNVTGWRREEFEDLHSIIEQLCKEYNVQTIYADSAQIGENQRLSARGLNVIPKHFVKDKPKMQARMKALFHTNRIRIDEEEIELLRQLRKYNWDTHTDDDRVDALMLSLIEEEKPTELYWKVL